MNKKRLIAFVTVIAILAMALTGCSFFGSDNDNPRLIFVGISGIDPIELDGSEITLPTPTKEGYIFDGWYLSNKYDVKFDQEYLDSHSITSDLKLYPKWVKIEKVTVTLDPNGGELEEDNVEINKGVTTGQELGIPTYLGKTFVGWYTSADGGEKMTDSDGIIKNYSGDDVTLYAHWEATLYTVEVKAEGTDTATVWVVGSDSVGDSSYVFGDKITVSTACTDARYEFMGWYVGDEEEGAFTTLEDYTITDNVTLVAKWRGEEITINFYINADADDETYVVRKVRYGEDSEYKPERIDYVFTGWYSDRDCSGTAVSAADGKLTSVKPEGKTLALYAGWKELPPEGTCGLTYSESENAYTVTGLNDDTASIVYIPAEYNGITVTSIAAGAFSDYGGKAYVLPCTISSVAEGAFPSDATIYVDNGVDPSIIATPAFSASMEIYFHLLIKDTGKNALKDGAYAEADGKFITTEITSMADALSLYQYCFLYTVEEVTMHFTDTAYNGTGTEDDFKNAVTSNTSNALNKLGLKTNTNSTYNISYDVSNRTFTYKFKEKSENRVATVKTDGADQQVQSTPANLVVKGSKHDFKIDKKPSYYVTTSEQLIYAVERGYKPYFADKTSEAYTVYQKAREALTAIVNADMTDSEKCLRIHDWIAVNVIYDTELLNLANSGKASDELQGYREFNVEGVFIDGRAVCDGIAKAFTLMARIEGIECVRVSGTMNNSGHAWNKVKLDDVWYVVDVTGDDVVTSFAEKDANVEVLKHDFFLTSDEAISATHTEAEYEDSQPATGTYDYFGTNGYYYTDQKSLDKAFERVVSLANATGVKSGDMFTFEFKVKKGLEINYNYIYKKVADCTIYGGKADENGVVSIIVEVK